MTRVPSNGVLEVVFGTSDRVLPAPRFPRPRRLVLRAPRAMYHSRIIEFDLDLGSQDGFEVQYLFRSLC